MDGGDGDRGGAGGAAAVGQQILGEKTPARWERDTEFVMCFM